MTPEKLVHLCKIWQRRLRLSDWSIVVGFVPQDQLIDEQGTLWGRMLSEESEQSAQIAISEEVPPDQLEATLVHELLHIRLLPFDAPDQGPKEVAINLLADVLVRALRRRERKKECSPSAPKP